MKNQPLNKYFRKRFLKLTKVVCSYETKIKEKNIQQKL